jgi:hypothetical protein
MTANRRPKTPEAVTSERRNEIKPHTAANRRPKSPESVTSERRNGWRA